MVYYTGKKVADMEKEYRQLEFRGYARLGEGIRMMTDVVAGYHPAHTHNDFIEIAYVMAGRGEQTINGRRERIAEGDLFLFNPSVVHAFCADEDAPLTICNCLFLPTMVGLSPEDCHNFLDIACHYLLHRLYSEEAPSQYLRLSGHKTEGVRRMLEEMSEEYERREDGYTQILQAELTKLLIHIFRCCRGRQKAQDRRYWHRLLVREALSYMEEHAAEPITCELLARRAYLSVNYFRTVFREVTGRTVIETLQRIRAERACQLLLSTSLPVAQIAGLVGYSDVKFFYRVFREVLGVTPGEYRQKNTVEMPPKSL